MKKAFTIAEVLISLAIIGVIASLTLPNLNVNIQKSQCGTALMKAINDIDNANKWILNDTDSKSIKYACDIDEESEDAGISYIKCLAPPLKMDNYYAAKTYEYYDKANNGFYKVTPDDKYVYSLASVNIWADKKLQDIGTDTPHVPLFIDANGIEKGPNIYGKDLFLLFLNIKTNTLVGVDEYALLEEGPEGIAHIKEQCETGGGCCAQLVMNGKGKIDYKW